ncbi:MAG: glycerol acyltransferase [Bacteroidetes bacterium HGW-Bacteroidetes-9]|nr:MAG: glycerol acyltransferase [Bacteroidetes bacterium HGW-Bacteroidetes-9]
MVVGDTTGQPDRLIDIERVIAGKNPRLLKYIPGFLIKYLKRILHQDKLNAALYKHRDKMGLDFVAAILQEFNVKVVVKGETNLTKAERFVAVSNHPLGGLDGMALMHAVGKIRNEIVVPSNDFLLHLPNLRPLFIPVNKHGSNAENISKFNEAFSSDKAVLFFPAGLCSRKSNGKILDLEWKKTFLSKARISGRDILPVHISGRNSNFFYNLANFRKWLGLKVNIEMLYLVDEMFRQNDKHIVITFGKPIPLSVFDKRMNDKKWVARIREHVYKLEKNPDVLFTS